MAHAAKKSRWRHGAQEEERRQGRASMHAAHGIVVQEPRHNTREETTKIEKYAVRHADTRSRRLGIRRKEVAARRVKQPFSSRRRWQKRGRNASNVRRRSRSASFAGHARRTHAAQFFVCEPRSKTRKRCPRALLNTARRHALGQRRASRFHVPHATVQGVARAGMPGNSKRSSCRAANEELRWMEGVYRAAGAVHRPAMFATQRGAAASATKSQQVKAGGRQSRHANAAASIVVLPYPAATACRQQRGRYGMRDRHTRCAVRRRQVPDM